MVFTALC